MMEWLTSAGHRIWNSGAWSLKQQGMEFETAGHGIWNSMAWNWKQRSTEFETAGHRIWNSRARNLKQWGTEFETAGHGIWKSGARNWIQQSTKLEIEGCRIGNSNVQNWKQHGVELETVGHELPYVENSTVILTMVSENAKFVLSPTVLLQNAEFVWTPHSVVKKCRVCLNSSMYFLKMQSLVELPTLFLKNARFMQTLHSLEFKSENAEFNMKMWSLFVGSAVTPHCAFKKGRIEINSPLWFWKMRISHKLPLCEVSVFTTCAVRLNPPQCLFTKTQNLLEHPIPLSNNAELKRTPHCVYQKCGGCFKCPICFYKMRSPLELPTVLSENAEFVSTPHSIFTKCAVCLKPPLSF